MYRFSNVQGKNDRSTSHTFRHGDDVPITRANVAAYQADRAKRGYVVADEFQIAAAFVTLPTIRHVARAYYCQESNRVPQA